MRHRRRKTGASVERASGSDLRLQQGWPKKAALNFGNRRIAGSTFGKPNPGLFVLIRDKYPVSSAPPCPIRQRQSNAGCARRCIDATIPTLTPEERKRLAEYTRKSDPNFIVVLETLKKFLDHSVKPGEFQVVGYL